MKQLTEEQKASRVIIAKEHSGRFNHNENKVLNCVLTEDKMWVHYAEPETNKRQKDFLWKQRPHYRLENRVLGFIETLHKQ